MAKETNQPKPNYLKFVDLKNEYNLPKSTVYNLIKNHDFPHGIRISQQSVRFRRADVDAWFKHREALSEAMA